MKEFEGRSISSKELGARSVLIVMDLLKTNFDLKGIDETKAFGEEDRAGTDLILFPSIEFTNLTKLPIVRVQVKSSEEYLNGFLSRGKKLFGLNGHEYKKMHLVVLDGQWPHNTIVADFTAQVFNLMDILDKPELMEQKLNSFGSSVEQAFRKVWAQQTLQRYRGDMYNWVAGRPVIVNSQQPKVQSIYR